MLTVALHLKSLNVSLPDSTRAIDSASLVYTDISKYKSHSAISTDYNM